MKIALLGYGKMGKMIESLGLDRGHEITCKIDIDTPKESFKYQLGTSDVAIDFSSPDSAFDLIKAGIDAGLPVVSGTTGWLGRYEEMKHYIQNNEGSFLYASNFSIGVNLFFKLNRDLAEMMSNHPQYKAAMKEIHHIHKLDSPSGTAISLAEDIISCSPAIEKWINKKANSPNILGIESERKGEVPGTHQVIYQSFIDEISIQHRAFGREGFAHGALWAAEWLIGKKGIFKMADVLDI